MAPNSIFPSSFQLLRSRSPFRVANINAAQPSFQEVALQVGAAHLGGGGGWRGGGAEKVHACAKLRHSRLTRMRRSLFVSSNLTQPTLSPSVMLHFEKFKPNNLIEWAEVLCYSPTTKPRTHVYTHTHADLTGHRTP